MLLNYIMFDVKDLVVVCKIGHIDIVRLYLKLPNPRMIINQFDDENLSPLMAAALMGHIEIGN